VKEKTMTVAPELVGAHQDGAVLTLTLGAAPAHPLSLAMIEALHEALIRAGEEDTVGAIVIHGPGRIFCAGHDLKEIARHRREADHGRAFLEWLFTACGEMMQAVATSPKPTIAMVEGLATAAGLQLVASCDLAYAAPGARFCLPGVKNHGFCTTPSVAVSRSVTPKHLMEMALTGEPVDADWALAAGLINRILPDNELAPFVQDMAARLAGHNRRAVADGKRAVKRQVEMPLEQAYAHATEVMVGHFMDPERIEIEKRRWG
jgi:enoyl-CoA hydratase/carnithine racemase